MLAALALFLWFAPAHFPSTIADGHSSINRRRYQAQIEEELLMIGSGTHLIYDPLTPRKLAPSSLCCSLFSLPYPEGPTRVELPRFEPGIP